MHLLTAADVERIHQRTDELDLHRDWVVIPLNCAESGMELEMVLPDGKVLLRPPGRDAFEEWLRGLPDRLAEIGLSRTPRRSEKDPSGHLLGEGGPHSIGTRGYLARQPDLNVMDEHPGRLHGKNGG